MSMIVPYRCFPSCWKSPSVIPVFKNSGERSDPRNYRPISLLPVISKVFESILNSSVVHHLESLELFSDHQYGFRSSRSTADLLTVITERIHRVLDVSGEARAVALDISKAFDKVWHAGLLHKLKAYGISGSVFELIRSFLDDRHIRVVLDGHSSAEYTVNSGVPQGSVLGPTLFLIFINDLPDHILSKLGIYADDSTLYSCLDKPDLFSKVEMAAFLEDDLRTVVEWGQKWLVTFNDSKTKLLSINRHKQTFLLPVLMKGKELPESDSFRMLGLNFSNDFKWTSYIQSIAKAATKKVGSLYRAQKYLTPISILYLYKATIRPCIEYCCHLWAGAPATLLNLLDKIQKRICNLIGPDLSSELQSLSHRRNVASLSLFYKYLNGHCSQELSALVPSLRKSTKNTRAFKSQHKYTVTIPRYRSTTYQKSFFPRTASLWNSLPSSCFPNEFNMCEFKKSANKYLLSLL